MAKMRLFVMACVTALIGRYGGALAPCVRMKPGREFLLRALMARKSGCGLGRRLERRLVRLRQSGRLKITATWRA